jgi:tetratricopeptide (TPR) repeat protein
MAKVCLNMIVKNESKIILRLLKSVLPYIDTYCICDTGSTDDTIKIIETFFSSSNPGITGKIVFEPFKDFGHNRSFALEACRTLDADYILLLDADMIFWVNPDFDLKQFLQSNNSDVYTIFQGSDTYYYNNSRMVRNIRKINGNQTENNESESSSYSYWGVTHEYLKCPNNVKKGSFERSKVFIKDIGDGGCKTDKFERDVALLKQGLIDNPNNDRYTFYLANSYKDAGQYDNAIETYKKRIALKNWFEEVWYSYYCIGNCFKHKKDMVSAVYWWLEAYNYFPDRIENLYEIINHYRIAGKNRLAYEYYILAAKSRNKNKNPEYLFLQKDIYSYKLDFELSIVGYYHNDEKYDLAKISMEIMSDPNVEKNISNNVLSNFKFFTVSLKDIVAGSLKNEKSHSNKTIINQNVDKLLKVGESIAEIQPDLLSGVFNTSTPSICYLGKDKRKLAVNVRYVNYKINDKGGYDNGSHITTKNVVAIFDISKPDWIKKDEFLLNYNEDLDNRYVGLEDIRLFSNLAANTTTAATVATTTVATTVVNNQPRSILKNDVLYFNANRGLEAGKMCIETGMIDLNIKNTISKIIKKDGQNDIEKNWVMFSAYDKNTDVSCIYMIYNWFPLVIGQTQNENKFTTTKELKTPGFFKNIRGSTNGVNIGNEIWFICHTVSYEDRRYYYHIFVVLDSTTLELKRYSRYFTFEKNKVEYTLGFIQLEDASFLIGYSLMDRETKYININKADIENLMLTM